MVLNVEAGERIVIAHVWAVDPTRGDLYVVHFAPADDHLVQVDSGIMNRPEEARGQEMRVKCNSWGDILALPYEDSNEWCPCHYLGDSLSV